MSDAVLELDPEMTSEGREIRQELRLFTCDAVDSTKDDQGWVEDNAVTKVIVIGWALLYLC